MRCYGLGFVLIRIGNYPGEVPRDRIPLKIKPLAKGCPIGKTQHECDARLTQRISRQHLSLPVVDRLQRVLGVTQKTISGAELVHRLGRQIIIGGKGFQYSKNGSLL